MKSAAAALACAALACAATPYEWRLPRGFPRPLVPADNPMSAAKVELGRRLFYDVRLSVNRQMSCASCHRQETAFADNTALPVGATGQSLPRSSMSLVNVAYSGTLTWNRPQLHSLEKQLLIPMLAASPVELGLEGKMAAVLAELQADGCYQALFAPAFPGDRNPYTAGNIAKAIASFERSIVSARSPYDRYHNDGAQDAISPSAKRGEVIFFTEAMAGCYRCHGGFNFSDAVEYAGRPPAPAPFHNDGLYNLPGPFSYPASNLGIYESTRRPRDVGKFKAPTLRNIALTGPYMHDGSLASLADVIEHYATGGRHNPNQDRRVRQLILTPQNKKDLEAFLQSLTDQELLHDPRFANPW